MLKNYQPVNFKYPFNNKGAVLITAYMFLFVLMTLSSSIALFNFSELRDAQRYRDTTAAFWLAEAGIHMFMADPELLDEDSLKVVDAGRGTIRLIKNDADPRYRLVTSVGTVGGSERQIQIRYPVLASIFESTISSKGDMEINGRKITLMINDKLRLGGQVVNNAAYPLIFVEDKAEGVRESFVSIQYPDANHNGVEDEFDDFVAFNRRLMAQYNEDEVIYIKGNDAYTIVPDDALEGKKIIFIEGDEAGKGDAVIQFGNALAEGQHLTVITTGSVTHNQTGIAHEKSQLNIIAWTDYYETTVLPSVHNGFIFAHGKAYFDEVHDTSITNGSVVANDGIVIGEVWSTKTFNYADMRIGGRVPPGFEGLISGGGSRYTDKPNQWREI